MLHMRDLFFNGSYPYIDTSSGGRVDGLIAAADRVLKGLPDEPQQVLPGLAVRHLPSEAAHVLGRDAAQVEEEVAVLGAVPLHPRLGRARRARNFGFS